MAEFFVHIAWHYNNYHTISSPPPKKKAKTNNPNKIFTYDDYANKYRYLLCAWLVVLSLCAGGRGGGESLGLVLFYAHIVLRSRYFQVCDLWGNDEYAVKSYIFKYLIYTRLKLCSTVFL